jgi:hypoxanthine phosphoribosyltransferase
MIKTLITERALNARVKKLAAQISRDYKNKNVIVIAVLNGSFIFCADLIRNFRFDFTMDFVKVSSYKNFKSTGKLKFLSKLKESLKNRHVLIIEDIVDTGTTLKFLNETFAKRGALSVKTCCLLNKTFYRKHHDSPHYTGFTLKSNDFVVGYGLDHNGYWRGLKYIGTIKK